MNDRYPRALGFGFAVLIALELVGAATAPTARAAVWQDLGRDVFVAGPGPRMISPLHHRTVRLDLGELRDALAAAPLEFTHGRAGGLEFALPLPDGRMARFLVEESPIMEPALAARYPDVRTYRGRGIDDLSVTTRFGISRAGFHAIILSPSGTVYIDPFRRGDVEHCISYFKGDNVRADLPSFSCELLDDASGISPGDGIGTLNHREGVLRTYRLALAATFEYVTVMSNPSPPNKASAMTNGIIPTLNRVNGIYESDLGIHMNLVANDDNLIFDTSADPYTNNNGSAMLSQNISTCNSIIGPANYDMGHVFSTGGGGVAYLGVICSPFKAGGVTGGAFPTGDNFDVDYVAHEMGHQFGGNHTFNGNSGSCGGANRNASTAYEVGSGASIMAYAGICGAQNLQPHSYDEFHGMSLQEIIQFTNGSGGACAVQTPVANLAPEVDAGPSYTIPANTPFMLTAVATDADGDSIRYSWEEFDLGAAGASTFDNGNWPLFRPFESTTSPTRFFPRMSDILSGATTYGEIMPASFRTLNFRVIARDYHPVAGGVHWDNTQVAVVNAAGPFIVTAPNGGEAWDALTTQLVTWNVAGTDAAPVNVPTVDFLLSIDGGATFATVATGVPNDGSETFLVPATITSQARLMIRAGNNIFFDVSNANFSILGRPFAIADQAATAPNVPVIIDVLVNDSDPNGDLIAITEAWSPTAGGGTAVVEDSAILYTPAFTFSGTDTFTYVINDGGLSDTAQVTVDVVPTTAVGDRTAGDVPDFGFAVHPNPAVAAVNFDFQLQRTQPVGLSVFGIDGRRVATLLSGPRAAGTQSVRWDGRGEDGSRARAGVYWVQFSSGDRAITRRLVLMR